MVCCQEKEKWHLLFHSTLILAHILNWTLGSCSLDCCYHWTGFFFFFFGSVNKSFIAQKKNGHRKCKDQENTNQAIQKSRKSKTEENDNTPEALEQGWPWARARWVTALGLTLKLGLIPKFLRPLYIYIYTKK